MRGLYGDCLTVVVVVAATGINLDIACHVSRFRVGTLSVEWFRCERNKRPLFVQAAVPQLPPESMLRLQDLDI